MGLLLPTFQIGLLWIFMLMAMTPEDRIWNYTSLRCVKRLIGTVSCIWVANCGMIFPSLYKILQTLNHSNIIIKCPNCSLTPDWFNSFALVFAICQVLWWNDCSLLSEQFALYLDVDEFLYLILHIPYWIMFQFLVTLSWGFNCAWYHVWDTALCD